MFDKNQKTLINVFEYFLSTIAKKTYFLQGRLGTWLATQVILIFSK